MRFLFRLGILALAAVGAKTLYERFAPKAAELRGSAGDMMGSAKSAAQGVTQHAKDAAAEVTGDAKSRASDVAHQASSTVGSTSSGRDDAPTVANPTVSARA
jgi:hypothetical protein